MELFYPSKKTFPAISSTGGHCELNCEHCRGHYLKSMVDASDEGIYLTCAKAKDNGALGALISGGSDMSGKVKIDQDELAMCSKIDDFKVNVHIGLVDGIYRGIRSVAAVSVDMPPSDRVVKSIYHLEQYGQNEYFAMLDLFEQGGIRYVPHICFGIDRGRIDGELETLERLESYSFDQLVVLSLKGTPNIETTQYRVNTQDYEKALNMARDKFKYLSLGCMRDRDKGKERLWSYFDKIAWPSKIITDELLRSGIECNNFDTCCSVY